MTDIFEEYDGAIEPPIDYHLHDHADHCIESQHHAPGEYYPRRIPEKFEAIEGFFPKQDVMLVNVESKTKKSLVVEFTYSNEVKISREISQLDLVRVFFIDSANGNKLTEKIGKVYDINYQYNYIEIDCSENYESSHLRIPVLAMRFISNDLDEVPPFISKEKDRPAQMDEKYFRRESIDGRPVYYFDVFSPAMYTKPVIPVAPVITT